MYIELLNNKYEITEFFNIFNPIIKEYFGNEAELGFYQEFNRKEKVIKEYFYYYYKNDYEPSMNILTKFDLENLYKNHTKIKSLTK